MIARYSPSTEAPNSKGGGAVAFSLVQSHNSFTRCEALRSLFVGVTTRFGRPQPFPNPFGRQALCLQRFHKNVGIRGTWQVTDASRSHRSPGEEPGRPRFFRAPVRLQIWRHLKLSFASLQRSFSDRVGPLCSKRLRERCALSCARA